MENRSPGGGDNRNSRTDLISKMMKPSFNPERNFETIKKKDLFF